MVISLLVIAANPIQLPISIISGKTYAHIHQDFLLQSLTLEPTPVILAPMVQHFTQLLQIRLTGSIINSCFSFAKTAAITILAVPVTASSTACQLLLIL
jgi:hypothetical protein